MAIASDSTAGTVVLTADLHGSNDPKQPELIPTGVASGTYLLPDVVVDAKGRILYLQESGTVPIACATTTSKGGVKPGQNFNFDGSLSELSLSITSGTNKGLVQVGSGFKISSITGVLEVDYDPATSTSVGYVRDPNQHGLDVQSDGTLVVYYATDTTPGVVKPGNGIAIDSSAILSVVESEFDLIPATETSTGAIQIGNGLDVDASGVVTVNENELTYPIATDATTGQLGVVQIDNGLDVDANGVVTVNEDQFNYDYATDTSLGVVQIGSGINVGTNGVISVANGDSSNFGLVQSDEVDLTIDTNGELSFIGDTPTINQDATTTQKGKMQIGQHLNDDAGSGVVGVDEAVDSTTFGVVRSANTNNITFTSGEVDVGSNVATFDTQNTWTKAQVSQLDTITFSTSITPDFSQSNVFEVTLTDNTTINAPINAVAGGQYVIIIRQDSIGGWSVSFGPEYLFAEIPSNTTTADAVDLLNCVCFSTTEFQSQLTTDYK